jgi:hypothetical protein
MSVPADTTVPAAATTSVTDIPPRRPIPTTPLLLRCHASLISGLAKIKAACLEFHVMQQ